jgi:hypothetical protein
VKVALCIPCHGDTKADFTFCLARLIAASLSAGQGLEIETLIARSSLLVESRTRLFEWSRDWGADYILWLDSDQTFPPQALLRLLDHRVAIVGANYRRRHADIIPSAVTRGADGAMALVQTTAAKAAAGSLEEVERLGFGLLLMDVRAVVEAVGGALYPLFEIRSLPDGTFIGEDVIFCDKVRAAGLKIFVDHALSIWVGHIHEENLMFPR